MATFRYSIAQYAPSPVRDERLNVGVVVVGVESSYLGSKWLGPSEFGRLKRLGFVTEFGFLTELARSFAESRTADGQLEGVATGPWDADALDRASHEWANTVRLTSPRGVIHDRGDALVESLFRQLVADPTAPRKRARDRRWIQGRVGRTLRKAVQDTHPQVDPSKYVVKSAPVRGGIDRHTVDYELRNGQPLQFIESLAA